MKISVAAFVFFGLIGIVAVVGAQQSGAPRTILQRLDMSVPGREAVAAVADFAPGVSTGWLRHPGEMVGYVVRGTIEIEIQGQPTMTRRIGESVIIPAGVVHRATATEDASAQMFASYFVEKGRPLNGPPSNH
jgi:quercetin dioxygenase-like cupin family protein